MTDLFCIWYILRLVIKKLFHVHFLIFFAMTMWARDEPGQRLLDQITCLGNWLEGNWGSNLFWMVGRDFHFCQNTIIISNPFFQNTCDYSRPKIVCLWFFHCSQSPVLGPFAVNLVVFGFTLGSNCCFSVHMWIVVDCCQIGSTNKSTISRANQWQIIKCEVEKIFISKTIDVISMAKIYSVGI